MADDDRRRERDVRNKLDNTLREYGVEMVLDWLLQPRQRRQLSSELRQAIAAHFGCSLRELQHAAEAAYLQIAEIRLKFVEARIRKEVSEGKRERPRGGYRQAAVDELAYSPEWAALDYPERADLEQRLKRYRRRMRRNSGGQNPRK
jgi:hypothetical protein